MFAFDGQLNQSRLFYELKALNSCECIDWEYKEV